MSLYFEEDSSIKLGVVLKHNDETLSFNIKGYERTGINAEFDVYSEINKYWASLSQAQQKEIFIIYAEIKEILDVPTNTYNLSSKLEKHIVELIDKHHNFSDVKNYVLSSRDFYIPKEIPNTYHLDEKDSVPTTRERTYIKDDYIELLTFCVILRSMIPIWGEYITKVEKDAGSTFKDFYAYRLITHTHLVKTNAMDKLENFFVANIQLDSNLNLTILLGVSSEDLPEWLLSQTIVRKLSIADLCGHTLIKERNYANLAAYIYRLAKNKIDTITKQQGPTKVRDKKFTEMAGDEDNKRSRLEGYKIQEEMSIGDISIFNHFVNNEELLLRDFKENVTIDVIESYNRETNKINDVGFESEQICLVQWIMKQVMPPKAILVINKINLLKVIAIAQAIAVERGHNDIAILMSVTKLDSDDVFGGLAGEPKNRLSEELEQKLLEKYKFTIKHNKDNTLATSPIFDAIEQITNYFNAVEWKNNLPKEILKKMGYNTRRYVLPVDFKNKLALFILDSLDRRSNNEF